MIKRTLEFLKYPLLILTALIGVISCEKDFKNIGDDLLNDHLFSTGKYNAQVKGYSVKIDANHTHNLTYNLLGYTSNNDFGSLTASFITQLTLPGANPDFGDNAVIDSVLIIIPLESTLDGTQEAQDPEDATKTINVPNFKLDSVFTSGENAKFLLNVYESGTYLNSLDPTNPYISNTYKSDDVFLKTGTPLFSGLIAPNRNDTMTVIDRYKYVDGTFTNRVLYKKDTIKLDNKNPALKIPLDKQKIKQIFQDNASSSHFASNDNFIHFFRGLYFDAANYGTDNVLMYLATSGAYMNIYYTSSSLVDEGEDEDIDGDGINHETNVIKATSLTFQFKFTGYKANLYQRDRSGSVAENYLTNPNTAAGNDKIFINGAAGSDGVIHLFGGDSNTNGIPDELETLRNNTWLINDAKLYLYVDPSNTTTTFPENLYLYGIDGSSKVQPHEVFAYTTISEGLLRINGSLVYDEDEKPDYYLFHLTDYVSELIKSNDEVKIVDFGIKTYDPADIPASAIDTIMRKFNNNFKGVILTGNNTSEERKLKFEIYYTQKNN